MFVYKLFKSTQFELQNTMASVAPLVYLRRTRITAKDIYKNNE